MNGCGTSADARAQRKEPTRQGGHGSISECPFSVRYRVPERDHYIACRVRLQPDLKAATASAAVWPLSPAFAQGGPNARAIRGPIRTASPDFRRPLSSPQPADPNPDPQSRVPDARLPADHPSDLAVSPRRAAADDVDERLRHVLHERGDRTVHAPSHMDAAAAHHGIEPLSRDGIRVHPEP